MYRSASWSAEMTSMFAGEHIKNIAVPTAPLLRDTIIGQISLKIGLASEFPIQKSFHDAMELMMDKLMDRVLSFLCSPVPATPSTRLEAQRDN
jgi:hypothetical protein